MRDAARFKKDATAAPALGRQAAQYLRLRELADAQHSPLEGFPELVETTYRTLISGFVELQIEALRDTELSPGNE